MSDASLQPARASHPRAAEIEELLVGAVDLHCHSGPAAMPRILDHHEALMDCAAAKFRALVYKDHFYLGTAHAVILEKLVPDTGVRLFSGLALNNASGGFNPHAVDHAVKLGAKIIWMPTLSAANHIAVQASGQAKTFPKTAQKMLDPIPLTALDANGRVADPVKQILDLIAEADVILAGGHLSVQELFLVFEEARSRGVRKMLVNHPTYIVGCTEEDIRGLVALGAYMEHSICMFVEGRSKKFSPEQLARLIEVAGVERTVLCSDLGLVGSPRPVEGYREVVGTLLDLQIAKDDIRAMIGGHGAALLNL
ncbi:DUF6282 family protein [Phreatobacter sp. AB_2022a]|uniref:DUF6282 family protein n=1 Tax=Phreatobacter sp. AB_2022a TaxID=3003134 RepID=UPI00228704BF|nr:DUF6282 family protein [Phreatobacter sp. AB_2022a]MCZ0734894.1 DUF6282 family protein [Phreatobacter sp. AB_2022a]